MGPDLVPIIHLLISTAQLRIHRGEVPCLGSTRSAPGRVEVLGGTVGPWRVHRTARSHGKGAAPDLEIGKMMGNHL